jgi:hypothetical protein
LGCIALPITFWLPAQLTIMNLLKDWRLMKLSGTMFHESLLPAIAPQRFPCRVGSDFPHAALKGTNLQWLIAFWGPALQLPKDVAAAQFRVGHQPGQDLLPVSFEGVLSGVTPAYDPFPPLLLSVQGLEPCYRIAGIPLLRKYPLSTIVNRKDANGERRDRSKHRRATRGTAEDILLQLPKLLK